MSSPVAPVPQETKGGKETKDGEPNFIFVGDEEKLRAGEKVSEVSERTQVERIKNILHIHPSPDTDPEFPVATRKQLLAYLLRTRPLTKYLFTAHTMAHPYFYDPEVSGTAFSFASLEDQQWEEQERARLSEFGVHQKMSQKTSKILPKKIKNFTKKN